MRRQDKYRNIEQVNLMLENSYLKRKGLLKEEEPIQDPNSITVELTDEWKNEHNLYNMPDKVELPNNDKKHFYIGNTKLNYYSGIIYFASRRKNTIFITALEENGKNYDDRLLISPNSISQTEIDDSGLRKYPSGTTTLGPNADYRGPLEIGMTDHRGYFKIVEVK